MAHATSGSRVDSRLTHIARLFYILRSEIFSRPVERRVYNAIVQELWSVPDEYWLELGIDPKSTSNSPGDRRA